MAAGMTLAAPDAAAMGLEAARVAARILAEALLGAGVRVVHWWMEHPEVPRDSIAETILDMLWRGIAGMRTRARTRAKRPARASARRGR